MTLPLMYDVYCKAGGCTAGYMRAGFRVIGIDIDPQPRHCGESFIQMDAFEFFDRYLKGEFEPAVAMHASPPCQGYSIMRNLPWLREKEYPLLIKPTREALQLIGLPYVIENVMGARFRKQMPKAEQEGHGMQAGWLCGTMFGRPFYRHRLFETPFFWPQPGHPNHTSTIKTGRNLGDREHTVAFEDWRPGMRPLDSNAPKPRGTWEGAYQDRFPGASEQAALASDSVDDRGLATWPGRRKDRAGLTLKEEQPRGLTAWFNGAQKRGCGYGHAAGVDLVRAAMDIDWMSRAEITQAIPPCYTEYVGGYLMQAVQERAE